jgi:hypothetical protein
MLGRQIHASERILHESGAFEDGMANARPHRLKSLGTDHTQAELFKTEGRTICSETQNIIIDVEYIYGFVRLGVCKESR